MDMEIYCKGDTHIDDHHSVEDIGIVLGQAFAEAVYPVKGIERYGNSTVVMDEASVSCDLDISNRPFLVFELPIDGKVGTFDVELVEEFFRAFTFNAKLTLHLIFNRGRNRHHIIEASFKALAVALRRGLVSNGLGVVPSTKGVL
jgi:imidazoleglycerol-phosphate dehydratase